MVKTTMDKVSDGAIFKFSPNGRPFQKIHNLFAKDLTNGLVGANVDDIHNFGDERAGAIEVYYVGRDLIGGIPW